MPCPRVKRPMDGQRTKTTGRTKLLGEGGVRLQNASTTHADGQQSPPAPAAVSQGVAPLAPHFGCVDWEWAAAGHLVHTRCGGSIYQAGTNLPRRYCKTCGREWWWQDAWKAVGK